MFYGETVSAASSANTPRSHRVTPFPAPTRSAGTRFCRASRWRRSARCSTATRISTRRMRPSRCVSSSRCRECRRRTRRHRCSQWPWTSAFVPWRSRHSTSNPTSAVRMARNPSPSLPARSPARPPFLGSSLMFPLSRRGLKSRDGATGRYGRAACAWSLAQVSLRPRVRLKTSRPGVESGSGQK